MQDYSLLPSDQLFKVFTDIILSGNEPHQVDPALCQELIGRNNLTRAFQYAEKIQAESAIHSPIKTQRRGTDPGPVMAARTNINPTFDFNTITANDISALSEGQRTAALGTILMQEKAKKALANQLLQATTWSQAGNVIQSAANRGLISGVQMMELAFRLGRNGSSDAAAAVQEFPTMQDTSMAPIPRRCAELSTPATTIIPVQVARAPVRRRGRGGAANGGRRRTSQTQQVATPGGFQ